jgi:hypothetical protein
MTFECKVSSTQTVYRVERLEAIIGILSGEPAGSADWFTTLRQNGDARGQRRVMRTVAEAASYSRQHELLYEAHTDGLIDAFALDSTDHPALWERRTVEHSVMLPSVWKEAVPLVLCRHHFLPSTSSSRPSGNVIWIDARSPSMLLATLESAGVLRIQRLPDEAS